MNQQQTEGVFPARYRLNHLLGRGGGGEVWAATDQATHTEVAIKALHALYQPAEVEALIRETTTLSGLEGLGFPRVLHLGRAADGRLYLVRELVSGESFDKVVQMAPRRALSLLCAAASVLTVVHRAGLLHGDIKPANIIARADGQVALVDLGLAIALREGGQDSVGLTPHYAAPEVRAGGPLTVQAEVYSLGVILRDLLDEGADAELSLSASDRLASVAARATHEHPEARFPSADEFSMALRAALSGDVVTVEQAGPPWPVKGIGATAYRLKKAIDEMPAGHQLRIEAPLGSGCSTLLRRVAWELSLAGSDVLFIDAALLQGGWGKAELNRASAALLLIFFDAKTTQYDEVLARLCASGARVVRTVEEDAGHDFSIPPLDLPVVVELFRGALAGMPTELIKALVQRIGARPGPLRRFVSEAEGFPVIGESDIDRVLTGAALDPDVPTVELVERALDHGHYGVVEQRLGQLSLSDARQTWLRARYELAAGSAEDALNYSDLALGSDPEPPLRQRIIATKARAQLGLGEYAAALDLLSEVDSFSGEARAEGMAYRGLAETLLGRKDAAIASLKESLAAASAIGSRRLEALAGSALATAQWRAGDTAAAPESYRAAIAAARDVGDSGMLASSQINLAGLMKERGDLAMSIELLEGAVDAARRAGRRSSLQQALLNLTNTDLYLGRLERARAQIAQVGDPTQLGPVLCAQFHGLQAELLAREEDVEAALHEYAECRQAWEDLGRRGDAAEAALEAVLVAASYHTSPEQNASKFVPSHKLLINLIEHGERLLDNEENALLLLARARTHYFIGEEEKAEELAQRARTSAEQTNRREWAWRAAALEAEILEAAGKRTKAARATALAVEVLEDIGARLPQDLREVYWSEPRRRLLRARAAGESSRYSEPPARRSTHDFAVAGPGFLPGSGIEAVSRMTMTPLERRLARVLAINSDLASEIELERLATKIVGHACELLVAETGYLLLGRTAEELSVCACRGGGAEGETHRDFSRSIAQEVLKSGRPLVSIDAGADKRLQGFESVHQAAVSAVACVPVLSPQGRAIGALYLETRTSARPGFGDEVPTLQAFADQAAIALENARLLSELKEKGQALEERNERLREARERLKELLGKRTARLREVKKELRTTKDQLASHASYGGMVGASEQMRRVYSLIERVKDTDVPVLITGESGTGKEVVARAIHEGSARGRGKMLAVNCGAIPESILESELFGHVRGAFTGADRDRRGLFREADGGVLLLDEIGETPLKMQAGLLRVLQEGKVRPVGGSQEIAVDVRVVFATNRNLRARVEEGMFREDLLYRIQVVEIALPPLRERREDIPLLCDHFLVRFATRFGQEKKAIAREAMNELLAYPWPGNIRQLENVLLSAWVLCEGDTIEHEDLQLPAVRPESSPALVAPVANRGRMQSSSHHARARLSKTTQPKKGTLSEHQRGERAKIVQALEATGWNRVKAAEVLAMPRRTFYRRLKEYNIQ